MKTVALLLDSGAFTLSAAPAFAAKDATPLTVTGTRSDDPDTIRVSYADLSLGNAADAAVLRARVKRETRRICGALYSGALLQMEWACRDVAWRVAAPQIAAAIASVRTGTSLAHQTVVIQFSGR
jgi:UrcA family protein